MLRITVIAEDPERADLRIEGWLVGPAVELLRDQAAQRQGKHLVLHLQGLKTIDPAAVAMLQEWSRQGLASWRGAGTYVRLLLEARSADSGSKPVAG